MSAIPLLATEMVMVYNAIVFASAEISRRRKNRERNSFFFKSRRTKS